MLLLDYARSEGLAMRGLHNGRHIGYSTDRELVERVSAAGANALMCYGAWNPENGAGAKRSDAQVDGWEISFSVGREAVLPEATAA